MSRHLAALMAVGLMATGSSPAALAADPECEAGLDVYGRCDPSVEGVERVEWCTGAGEYRALDCPGDGDEICALAKDASGVELGYTCIPRELTACADIGPKGTCPDTVDKNILWLCVTGEKHVVECMGETECGYDQAKQGYDCVAKGRIAPDGPPEAVPDGPPEAGPEDVEPDQVEPDGAGIDTDVVGPTPELKTGEPWSPGSHDDGCSGAQPVNPALWLLALVLVGVPRRRQSGS